MYVAQRLDDDCSRRARYWSRNDGDTCKALATLSKPSRASSRGRVSAGSTSTSSRSRTAFTYSLRFRRCSPTRPGSECPCAAVSMFVSSQETNDCTDWESGCGLPAGGINRPRSLRMAFSQVSASWGISWGESDSKAMPPAQSVTLWHLLQYLSRKAHFRALRQKRSRRRSRGRLARPTATVAEDDAPTATADAQSTAVAAPTNRRAQNTPRARVAVFDVTALSVEAIGVTRGLAPCELSPRGRSRRPSVVAATPPSRDVG